MTGFSTAPCVLTRKTSEKLYFRFELYKIHAFPLTTNQVNQHLSHPNGPQLKGNQHNNKFDLKK